MAHVERNDGLKDGNKLAMQRYEFAIKCLSNGYRRVIDTACGMGYGTHLLNQAGHYVLGIDNSQEAIEYAKINYPSNYLVRDCEDYFLDNFDVTVCLEALCHFKNPQKFIDNIKTNELLVSAPIDPPSDDGYLYRLHNLSETTFKSLLKDWLILDEMWQGKKQKYLVIYCKKI